MNGARAGAPSARRTSRRTSPSARSLLVLGWSAELPVAPQALAPGLLAWTKARLGALLPRTPAEWSPRLGRDAESPAVRAFGLLSRRAASDNNEAVRPRTPPRP